MDQCGNKRPDAFAIYLELWHPDVFDFLDIQKNHSKEQQRSRNTVTAQKLWYHIIKSQIETDTPYMLYKDAWRVQQKEQPEEPWQYQVLPPLYRDRVCNLASIVVNIFVKPDKNYDFAKPCTDFPKVG